MYGKKRRRFERLIDLGESMRARARDKYEMMHKQNNNNNKKRSHWASSPHIVCVVRDIFSILKETILMRLENFFVFVVVVV